MLTLVGFFGLTSSESDLTALDKPENSLKADGETKEGEAKDSESKECDTKKAESKEAEGKDAKADSMGDAKSQVHELKVDAGSKGGRMGKRRGRGAGKTKYKLPPAPEAWSLHVLESLPVDYLFGNGVNLTELLGNGRLQGRQERGGRMGRGMMGMMDIGMMGGMMSMGGAPRSKRSAMDFEDDMMEGSGTGRGDPLQHCMAGISEAVERSAEHGSYLWLRVMPILKKFRKSHGGSDRVRVPLALGEKHAAEFTQKALEIIDDVATQDDIAAVEKPTHEQKRRDCQQELNTAINELQLMADNQQLGNIQANDQAREPELLRYRAAKSTELEELRKELPCVALGRMWVETLVEYAPFMMQLQQLDRETLVAHAEHVLPQVHA
jgi:hypothetical protein